MIYKASLNCELLLLILFLLIIINILQHMQQTKDKIPKILCIVGYGEANVQNE